jgi:phosphoribosylamine--glycine ligase
MTVLVVGSGGREHALILKLRESKDVRRILCAPGNGGIAADAECFDVKATDIAGMTALAKAQAADFVVVAPDDPLALGMVDALEEAGFAAFGPNKAAAAIESSKIFAKDLMKKYNIPTARYETFDDAEQAKRYIHAQKRFPAVIKADGLAFGKGVVIAQNEDEAMRAVDSMMIEGAFGESGRRVVIEEFLQGVEVSVLTFCDGHILVPMGPQWTTSARTTATRARTRAVWGPSHPIRCLRRTWPNAACAKFFMPTLRAMNAEGRPFRGCLYFGLMLTAGGPKVIEYNCRFGDPETQVVLPLLDGDLLQIMRAVRDGRLAEVPVMKKPGAAACVVIASGGYPASYKKGSIIRGLDSSGRAPGVTVCHAGTLAENGTYRSNGGRVLGVCATAETLAEALKKSYAACENIGFEGSFYRRDIGARALP